MRAVQERFGKTDGVVALHAYQSFREGEVTPEQCHEIGVALARKVWGKRFQVLVATHMNTDNLHNHFVINSVSYVDGKKYEQRRSQYAEFRAASDKLCREYGLSVVEQPRSKEPARYARMREAIDQACEDASTPEDFHRALYRQGYIFGSDPHRKYATIRARDGGRAVRLYRLGEEYDLATIDDRLRGNYLLYGPRLYELKHPPRQNTPKRYRPTENRSILQIFFEVFFGESQMHRLYLYYCYQLGILPKKQQPRINRPELERIWKDTEKILAEHAFVHDHQFPSLQAIVDYRKGLSQQVETLHAQRAEIVKQMRRKDAPPELADRRAMLTCKIAELRNYKLTDLRKEVIRDFYEEMRHTPRLDGRGNLSEKSVEGLHNTLCGILSAAVDEGYLTHNPAWRCYKPKGQKKERPVADEETVKKLITAFEGQSMKYETYFKLVLATGLRRGEACGLKWSDINWRKRTIHVQRGVVKLSHQESITKDPKTTSGDRMVYLSKEMCQLLKAWRKECEWDRQQTANETVNEDDYLFRQPNGKPMNPCTFTYRFKLILKANNLPLNLNVHSLRHTNASLLIAQGVDVRTVASLLGHAQASTTLDIYAHAFDKNKRKAQEKLGKTIGL